MQVWHNHWYNETQLAMIAANGTVLGAVEPTFDLGPAAFLGEGCDPDMWNGARTYLIVVVLLIVALSDPLALCQALRSLQHARLHPFDAALRARRRGGGSLGARARARARARVRSRSRHHALRCHRH